MIATTMMGFLMAGITSTLIFMLRSSVSLGNYAEMNRDGSYFLEKFGREIRMASQVNSISRTAFIVVVANASGDETVEYAYLSAPGQLIRTSLTSGTKEVLLDNISTLDIGYYNILGGKTSNINEVKAVQLRIDLIRVNVKNDNSDHIISARFNMRNRIITN
ncbi:hypothetical protein JIN80_09885 [Cerasicoccus arenae]|nr:hypothetical protein [Cerasicoccus arenae]